MKKSSKIIFFVVLFVMGLALASYAAIPAPPVNQLLGKKDVTFNNLAEPQCRECHGLNLADRHHLANQTCSSCHQYEWNAGCACWVPIVTHDCMACHKQSAGATVHHQGLLDLANALKLPPNPDCVTQCHGSYVDKTYTGVKPTYLPSLVTPTPSGGDGLPLNVNGKGAGACNYCHSGTGCNDTTQLCTNGYMNSVLHHSTGFNATLNPNGETCKWCHITDTTGKVEQLTSPYAIRVCENCHGMYNVHNIQADSNGDNKWTPYSEAAGYGHVGKDSDCWGCHGFKTAALGPAPTGPIVPQIDSLSISKMTAGTATQITINGQALVNTVEGPNGPMDLASNIVLTDNNGGTVTVIPSSINPTTIVATIPTSVPAGIYNVSALKVDKVSPSVPLAVMPVVEISSAVCSNGTLTVSGNGFGENQPSGDAVTVKTSGRKNTGATITCSISDWTNTQIIAQCTSCSGTATVKSVFGTDSASAGGGGGGKKK